MGVGVGRQRTPRRTCKVRKLCQSCKGSGPSGWWEHRLRLHFSLGLLLCVRIRKGLHLCG